jgi:hypothetical protein
MARKQGQTRAKTPNAASGSSPPQQMNWPKQTLKQLGNALTTAGTHFTTLAQSGGGRGGARTGSKTGGGGAGRAMAKSRSNPTTS